LERPTIGPELGGFGEFKHFLSFVIYYGMNYTRIGRIVNRKL
jgi:hypothetical protein